MKLATLVIPRRGPLILLGRKLTGEIGLGTYNAPGGKKEHGETVRACACRETLEEVGIEVDPADLQEAAVLKCFALKPTPRMYMMVFVYFASRFTGMPRNTQFMTDVRWLSQESVPYAQMLESDRDCFPRLLAGERFIANITYKQQKAKGYVGTDYLPLGA
jgi:8-oxo-dGTP diphosphatase